MTQYMTICLCYTLFPFKCEFNLILNVPSSEWHWLIHYLVDSRQQLSDIASSKKLFEKIIHSNIQNIYVIYYVSLFRMHKLSVFLLIDNNPVCKLNIIQWYMQIVRFFLRLLSIRARDVLFHSLTYAVCSRRATILGCLHWYKTRYRGV